MAQGDSKDQRWGRVTIYVTCLKDDSFEHELRVVAVDEQTRVLWVNRSSGSEDELNSWAAESLQPRMFPGYVRHQAFPLIDRERVPDCPNCGEWRTAARSEHRLVCPRCDRHDEAPFYATQVARLVQDGIWDESVQDNDERDHDRELGQESYALETDTTTASCDRTRPSDDPEAFRLMIQQTLAEARTLAQSSTESQGTDAASQRSRAYGLLILLREWLAPQQDTVVAVPSEGSKTSNGDTEWDHYEALPVGQQLSLLAQLLERIRDAAHKCGLDAGQAVTALRPEIDPMAVISMTQAPLGAHERTASDPFRQVILAALLTMGLMGADIASAEPRTAEPAAISQVLKDARDRFPSIAVESDDRELAEAFRGYLQRQGVAVTTQHSGKEGVARLVMAEDRKSLQVTIVDPNGKMLAQTVIRGNTENLESQDRMAVTIDDAIERISKEVAATLKRSGTSSVKVSSVLAPTWKIGVTQIEGVSGVTNAVADSCETYGLTVDNDADVALTGGVWDTAQGSELMLWTVAKSGEVRHFWRQPLAIRAWIDPQSYRYAPKRGFVTADIADPRIVGIWDQEITSLASQIVKEAKAQGHVKIGIPQRHANMAEHVKLPWSLTPRLIEQMVKAEMVPVYQHVDESFGPSSRWTVPVKLEAGVRATRDRLPNKSHGVGEEEVVTSVSVSVSLKTSQKESRKGLITWKSELEWPQSIAPVKSVHALPDMEAFGVAWPHEWPKIDAQPVIVQKQPDVPAGPHAGVVFAQKALKDLEQTGHVHQEIFDSTVNKAHKGSQWERTREQIKQDRKLVETMQKRILESSGSGQDSSQTQQP